MQLVLLIRCSCIPTICIGRGVKPERKAKRFGLAAQQEMMATEVAKQKEFKSKAIELRKQSINPFSHQRKMAGKLNKDAKISGKNVEEIRKLSQTDGYAIVQKTKDGNNAKIKAWKGPS